MMTWVRELAMPVFLFTDIENSTLLWTRYGRCMGKALARHDAILTGCIESHGGKIIKHTGDGVFAAFEDGQPLACALAIQEQLAQEKWEEIDELRVRIAVNKGEAEQRGSDYFGPAVNRASRLLTVGWGGQILLTYEASLLDLPPNTHLYDFGVHLLKDLGEPQHIYGLVHPNLVLQEFPPLRSLSSHPHNLPSQPTPFVGRQDELAGISERLVSNDCRILTLLGAGGVGKTRLALQTAAGQVELFSHGVFFVPLAAITSPEMIYPAVAEALKFNFYSREEPKVQIQNYLHEKQILLVLDNFEHVTGGALVLSEIASAAPLVKFLVTSRERLDLSGEWTVEITGLKYPDDDGGTGQLESYSAMQLFLQSALRLTPGFSLTEEDRIHLVRICRLVEGSPLGIELAASWVRMLSCKEIADEVERSLDFLSTKLRDVPERHRSLRAVFDYSWSLLSDEERLILSRLSVFRGGFQRQAAERTAQASLRTLAALVDKSLIRPTLAGRYEIHESIRQYAVEKLAGMGDEHERTFDLHSETFATFLSEKEVELGEQRQLQALDEIRLEMDNIRLAWKWMIDRRKRETLGKSLEGLYLFYDTTSRVQEGWEMLTGAARSLRGTAQVGNDLLLAKLQARRGWFSFRLGRYPEARQWMEASLGTARAANQPDEIAYCLSHLAEVHRVSGDIPRARQLSQESLEIYREIQNRPGIALALYTLGTLAYRKGEYNQARPLLQESLSLFRDLQNLWGMGRVLNALGSVVCEIGDQDEAFDLRQESLEIFKQIDDRRGIAMALTNLSESAASRDQDEQRLAYQQEACAIFHEIGDRRLTGVGLNNLGGTHMEMGHHDEAKRMFNESLGVFREINDYLSVAFTLCDLGNARLVAGDLPEAHEKYHQALVATLTAQSTSLVLSILARVANFHMKVGRLEKATELCAAVLEHPESDGDARERVTEVLTQIEGDLPAEQLAAARERGRSRPLPEIVKDTLDASK